MRDTLNRSLRESKKILELNNSSKKKKKIKVTEVKINKHLS
jgi:hypothetical protein